MGGNIFNSFIVASSVAILLSSKSASAFSFVEMYNRILSTVFTGVAPKTALAPSRFVVATNAQKKMYHQQFESRHRRVSMSAVPKLDPTYSSGSYLKYTTWGDDAASCGGGQNPIYGESVLMNTCMLFNETSSFYATQTSPELAVFLIFPAGDSTCSSNSPADYYQIPLGCNHEPNGTYYHTAVSTTHGWGDNTGYGFV